MLRAFLHVIFYLLVVGVNILANALPLNGQTTGEISDRLDVMFTPAGYVFSIWGLIYILLGIWVLREFPQDRRDLPLYENTSLLFILTCLLNSAWIFAWHYEFFLVSVLLLTGLLLTLIFLYVRLQAASPSFFDRLPFSVYLGWVSVAVVANFSYYLVYISWDGFGLPDAAWTIIMLCVASALAIVFRIKNSDRIYPLVFVWAFIGIAVRNWDEHAAVSYTALGLAAVILIFAVIPFKRD
ncbi:tryptophan-rich sensory protein [Bacillus infantis]|uniref:tryptophan-rich sensory protein n=1 Tax=Bacillus infantis TaxID=324767 RepID=UPI003CEB4C83